MEAYHTVTLWHPGNVTLATDSNASSTTLLTVRRKEYFYTGSFKVHMSDIFDSVQWLILKNDKSGIAYSDREKQRLALLINDQVAPN